MSPIRARTLSSIREEQSSGEEESTTNISNLIPALEEWIAYGMNLTHTPGVAIAVVQHHEVIHVGGYGYRNLAQALPVTPTTVFQLASVSKPITGSLVAQLVGDGGGGGVIIDWDTPIISLDPAFRLSDPYVTEHVTIRDMLSHRSGLPDHAGDLQEDMGYTREQVLHNLRHLPLQGFRQQSAYTNFGFSEAGYAVAQHLNQTWSSLMQERLLGPLGMTQTSTRFEDYIHSTERAVTYQVGVAGSHSPPPPRPLDPPRQPDAQSPAGGVSSTATDLAQWLILQLGHRPDVIDPEALQQSQQPVVWTGTNPTTGYPSFYGIGWNVGIGDDGLQLGHSGAFAMGVRTEVSVRLGSGVGLAVLANASPTGLPEAIRYAFWELVHGNEPDRDTFQMLQDLVASQITPPNQSYTPVHQDQDMSFNMSLYASTYHNDYWGNVPVTYEETQDSSRLLVLHLGTHAFSLIHLTDHVFAFETVGENKVGESQVIFGVDAENKVRSMEIDFLNSQQEQQGFFTHLQS